MTIFPRCISTDRSVIYTSTAGISEEARRAEEFVTNRLAQVQGALSLKDGRDEVMQDLCAVYEECGKDGWAGPTSVGITQAAYRRAYHFIELLPFGVAMPTVGVEPDGYMTLQWGDGERGILSVSVGDDSDIHYAFRNYTPGAKPDKGDGRLLFAGSLPVEIERVIRQIG